MENLKSVDQKKFNTVAELIAKQPELFAEQGAVVASWRNYRQRRLGPYYRLTYRVAGRQCCIYLGASQELAQQIRALLAERHAPCIERRARRRLRAESRAQLRHVQRELDEQLRRVGLRLKGFELRGWRAPALARAKRRSS